MKSEPSHLLQLVLVKTIRFVKLAKKDMENPKLL